VQFPVPHIVKQTPFRQFCPDLQVPDCDVCATGVSFPGPQGRGGPHTPELHIYLESEHVPFVASPVPVPHGMFDTHIPCGLHDVLLFGGQYPVIEPSGGSPHGLLGIHVPRVGLPVILSQIVLLFGGQYP